MEPVSNAMKTSTCVVDLNYLQIFPILGDLIWIRFNEENQRKWWTCLGRTSSAT